MVYERILSAQPTPPFPACIFIITLLGYKINSENMTLLQILLSYTSNNLENGAEK
jgi:hypothetical protein